MDLKVRVFRYRKCFAFGLLFCIRLCVLGKGTAFGLRTERVVSWVVWVSLFTVPTDLSLNLDGVCLRFLV